MRFIIFTILIIGASFINSGKSQAFKTCEKTQSQATCSHILGGF